MGAALYAVIWHRGHNLGQNLGLPRGARAWAGWAMALVVLALLVLPILASLVVTAGAALGHLPAIGKQGPHLTAVQQMLALPGLARATALALISGLGAAMASLGLAIAMAAFWGDHPRLGQALAPFLAIPHAAMAVGLAFLLAPSGWIARGLAPLVGWVQPPDLAFPGDAFGLALMLGLTVKETPFLLLMILTALRQIPLRAQMQAGLSLGYGRGAVWLWVIWPQIWPLMRLPLAIVVIYGLSVVDMALILGPSHPPTLAVWVLRLYASPDVAMLLPAAAGAMALLALGLGVLAAGQGLALALGALARRALRAGRRGLALDAVLGALAYLGAAALVLGALAMALLALWSLAWRWPWPDLLPSRWTALGWQLGAEGAPWAQALAHSLQIALASTALSLGLAMAWLECAPPRAARRIEVALVLPLLIPPIALLFGLNMLMVQIGLGGSWAAVVWGHLVFVLPYVLIALSGPWRALDPRYARLAQSLGARPWRRFWAVKLPLLLAPICTAAALGVAVSVAQYLPTLFLGAGRFPTLTTEAVALAASSNRRVTAVVSTLQAALPLLAYLAAVLIPAYVFRNRRDLSGKAGR